MGISGFAVSALLATACVAGRPEDDGFRARLSEGCRSDAACAELEREAHNRHAKCVMRKDGECREELADRQSVRALQKELAQREQADRAARLAQRRADYDAAVEAGERTRAAAAYLTGACEDRDVVSQAVASIPSNVNSDDRAELEAHLRQIASKRREARRIDAIERLQFAMRRPFKANESSDPARDVAAKRSEAEAHLAALDCPGEPPRADSAAIREPVDAWLATLDKLAADELRCRASAECAANRAAEPLCRALENRRLHQEMLARERRNPAGVVNLRYLHDLGQSLQDDEDEIGRAKAAYAAEARAPFREARCASRK